MLGRRLMWLGCAQWVTVIDDSGQEELAFRIFGINFGYYKDHKPLVWPKDCKWFPVTKREYGETIRPTK